MPELRTRMIQEVGVVPNFQQGFWIRTAASAAAVPQRKQTRRVAAASNRENIIPDWAESGRRRLSQRRSPLPAWFPRTPLRDITNIVQALERRNARIRRDAWDHHETEASAENEVLQGSPLLQEPYTFDHTPPGEVLPADISDTSSTLTDATLSPVSPNQHSQNTPSSTMCSLSEIELVTSHKDLQMTEYEKKLGSSIDEIEKAVLGNLDRPTKVAAKKKKTRALMTMR